MKPNLDDFIKEHQKAKKELEQKIAEAAFYKSLINATKECGGITDWLTPETTLKELADTLAINNVRFYYKSNNHNRSI